MGWFKMRRYDTGRVEKGSFNMVQLDSDDMAWAEWTQGGSDVAI